MEFISAKVLGFIGVFFLAIAAACRMAYLNLAEQTIDAPETEELRLTHRGFQLLEFRDAYGVKCSLQQSSAIGSPTAYEQKPGSSYIWLGIDSPQPRIMKSIAVANGIDVGPGEVSGWMDYPIAPEIYLSGRMHLDKEKAAMLVKRLSRWIETGELE